MVVLAGTVAADPVQRRMPSGDQVTEFRLSVPEAADRSADGPALAPRRTAKGPETTGTDPNANPQVAVQIR